jgi:hypothetical protein
MMSEIQKFVPANIPAVAALFMRTFRTGREPASDSLKAYFEELYFRNPWNDGTMSSFVALRPDGSASGFIGALPRRMMLGEREIRVVVAGNHMVDQDTREPFVGSNLLRRLLEGPQELTITDSANEISRRLWEKMGAVTLLNYSLRWVRILRPLSYSLGFTPLSTAGPVVRALLAPPLWMGDRLGRRFVSPAGTPASGLLTGSPLTAEIIVSSFIDFVPLRSLRPVYQTGDVRWLLSMARTKEQFGEMKAVAVTERDLLIGWYIYYGQSRRPAEVLQVAARHGSMTAVLHHLAASAFAEGCTALTGSVDPRFLPEYHAQKSILLLRDMYTIGYSGNAEVLRPLLAGDAFFSRLEGEWWTRLQGDRFT